METERGEDEGEPHTRETGERVSTERQTERGDAERERDGRDREGEGGRERERGRLGVAAPQARPLLVLSIKMNEKLLAHIMPLFSH